MKRVLPLLIIIAVLGVAFSAAAVQKPARTAKPAAAGAAQPNWWGPPPPQGEPDRGPKVHGPVAAVGENSITLRTPSGFNTYAVGPDTEIRVGGRPGALADISVGFVANVSFEYDQANLTTHAKRIGAVRPEPNGRITSIEGNLVRITDEGGTVWEVTTTPETRIMWLRIPLTMADLRIGYGARAEGPSEGNRVQARAIQARLPFFKGAVTDINNNSIRVKTVDQRTIEGVMSDRTMVVIHPRVGPNTPGTRADIRRGMAINIGGHIAEGQPMDVLLVELLIGE
ncbi:MAG: hypothetical protein Q7T82_02190 [Armatimonadota bacterium]|nr:hypothetical protein [Armatimonadota bacterium]